MAKQRRKKIKEATSYDVHALLDFIMVEAAVENRSIGKRIRIPYKNVLQPDPKYKNAELVIELLAYWDGNLDHEESEDERKYPNKLTGPNKGRH